MEEPAELPGVPARPPLAMVETEGTEDSSRSPLALDAACACRAETEAWEAKADVPRRVPVPCREAAVGGRKAEM